MKCSEVVEDTRYDIDASLCGVLYNEKGESIVTCWGTYLDEKMNWFVCQKKDNC